MGMRQAGGADITSPGAPGVPGRSIVSTARSVHTADDEYTQVTTSGANGSVSGVSGVRYAVARSAWFAPDKGDDARPALTFPDGAEW